MGRGGQGGTTGHGVEEAVSLWQFWVLHGAQGVGIWLTQLALCCVGPPSFQTLVTATNVDLLISPLSLSSPCLCFAHSANFFALCWGFVFSSPPWALTPFVPGPFLSWWYLSPSHGQLYGLLCGVPFSLHLADCPPVGKEHASALREMLSFGWEGLVSWQCQSEDPPLLETKSLYLCNFLFLPLKAVLLRHGASCQGHMKS